MRMRWAEVPYVTKSIHQPREASRSVPKIKVDLVVDKDGVPPYLQPNSRHAERG